MSEVIKKIEEKFLLNRSAVLTFDEFGNSDDLYGFADFVSNPRNAKSVFSTPFFAINKIYTRDNLWQKGTNFTCDGTLVLKFCKLPGKTLFQIVESNPHINIIVVSKGIEVSGKNLDAEIKAEWEFEPKHRHPKAILTVAVGTNQLPRLPSFISGMMGIPSTQDFKRGMLIMANNIYDGYRKRTA